MAVCHTLLRLVQRASLLLYRGGVEPEHRYGTVFFSREIKNCETVIKTAQFLSPRLERPETAYFEALLLFLYLSFVSFQNELRSRWPSGKVPGSNPDSTEDASCIGPVARQIIRLRDVPPVWCGSLERVFHLRRCPCHLPTVQNDEVRLE
ncbi:hypothetical protein AVEN_137646-1 [Araneus ventricosus]|uniref:Uncharacterized protein n=1 Tax=Araneus ventricosus TaxID=182803 RepID=A0A4Y2K7W6_ARAVE|nr:hypothetical protein AVEN_137646-1 [Araneus ventricosus]